MRLKYGYVVRCTGFTKDADGRLAEVTCEYLSDTFSGTPGELRVDEFAGSGSILWGDVDGDGTADLRIGVNTDNGPLLVVTDITL